MAEERRRFFRIEDIVSLKAEVLAEDEADDRIETFWNDQHQYSLRNEFNYKIEQHQADLRTISRKSPELGRYLQTLQQQLDLLAEKLLHDEERFDQLEKHVNLSAQGVSFFSDEEISNGSLVEIHLQFNPGKQKIAAFGRVISCEEVNETSGRYRIALDFEHIHEADREIIVKHVHGKQLSDLNANQNLEE